MSAPGAAGGEPAAAGEEGGRGRRGLDVEVGELELRPVVHVPHGASLRQAARVMRAADVSALLVGELPRELVTERDLTRALALGLGGDEQVETVASPWPYWVTTTSHLVDAARMMLAHEVRHLLVVTPEGRVAGILSMRQVFSGLLGDRV
ncbi:MAG TPA: CBS domain-containing protein [Acidimicrobiales bacterium]|nr:CBS domain-containing protein [Acidimicrobiales bacterium]